MNDCSSQLPGNTNSLVDTSLYGYIMSLPGSYVSTGMTQKMYILGKILIQSACIAQWAYKSN